MNELYLGMPRPELVDDEHPKVGNATRGGLICTELIPLTTRWERFRQAWGRSWQDGQALLLTPVDAVHAFGAPDGLRVHFLDPSWNVLASLKIPRRRALPAPESSAAALLLPSFAPELPLGDQLELLGAQPRLPDRHESE
ncbi:MAG: hypothetical protein MK209_10510 [Planctomycetes bacterium]|nr:hypothetical protein [Planctomycetota bacterium]